MDSDRDNFPIYGFTYPMAWDQKIRSDPDSHDRPSSVVILYGSFDQIVELQAVVRTAPASYVYAHSPNYEELRHTIAWVTAAAAIGSDYEQGFFLDVVQDRAEWSPTSILVDGKPQEFLATSGRGLYLYGGTDGDGHFIGIFFRTGFEMAISQGLSAIVNEN